MKTSINRSIITKSVFPLLFLLASGPLALADVKLSGVVGARTIDDDVVIARNTSCTLEGTIIKGNVRVLAGAKLITKRARIEGNVQAYDSFNVDLRNSTRVGGDVQGEGTRTVKVRGGTRVEGNVQIKEASAPTGSDVLLVTGATVDGDVQAEKSSGRLEASSVKIGGNLQFVENRKGPYLIASNRIDGDLQFFKNKGAGVIKGNTVKGNLQSKENSPAPKVSGNKVEGDLELE